MRQFTALLALACLFVPCLARPMYCTNPHPSHGFDFVEFVPLRVTTDGRLQYRDHSNVWTEWDWKLFPAYMRDAAQHDIPPYVVIAVHDKKIRFEKIIPIIRQVQIAGLPQLWLEAEPRPKRIDQDFQTNEDVICLLKPSENYGTRPVVTLRLTPDGDIFWNGERLKRAQVMARIGGRNDPIIKIVPSTGSKVTEVVQVMWEIAEHGDELTALDVE